MAKAGRSPHCSVWSNRFSRLLRADRPPLPKTQRCRLNQSADLLLAENLRKPEIALRIRGVGDAPGSLQDGNEKEPQCTRPLIDRVRRQLTVPEQMCLILTDVRRLGLIRRTLEVPR